MSKLNSKSIYAVLRKLGSLWAAAREFRIRPNGSDWEKTLPSEHTFALRFQSDKWGFSERSGNQFTLNLLVYKPGEDRRALLNARYGDMLESADRDAMTDIHRRIMARRTPGETDDDEDTFHASSTDPWLRAYDEEDVRLWWTELLEPRLDRICERFLETGGAKPTPVTNSISLPSLELTEQPEWATISLSANDAPMLAGELRSLSVASPMFAVVQPTTHFIFERRARYHSGIATVRALGILQHRRVWIELGPKALDELADLAARAQPANVRLLESSHLELEIRAS